MPSESPTAAQANALPHPIEGGERIARYIIGLTARTSGQTMLERTVNGRPGLVLQLGETTATVVAFEIAGDRIKRLWAVRNPDKLRQWTTGGND
ncbi:MULTISPECIES: hypothetical protein [Nocardia]|uniref:hypothetical protein n=2 Tax=Nocardiaceae TaxID=85025 RepID=UPI00191630F0|nr:MULTISPECIES: hypothetical protein [Nocardia]